MLVVLECPCCGAAGSVEARQCKYCGSPFVFQSLKDFKESPSLDFKKAANLFRKAAQNKESVDEDGAFSIRVSLGLCYLKQKAYPLAIQCFSRLIDESPEQPQPYIYKSLAMLAGKKPRSSNLKIIQEIGGLLGVAQTLGASNGQAAAMQAVIEFDYFGMNGLRFPSPTPAELISNARNDGMDIDELLASAEIIGLRENDISNLI